MARKNKRRNTENYIKKRNIETFENINRGYINTDKEIWREKNGDYHSDAIHVTEYGGIGIKHNGHVIVATIKNWHEAGELFLCVNPKLKRWKWRLAMWLLGKKDINHKEIIDNV